MMELIGVVCGTATIVWGFTLLLIIHTVRKHDFEFVKDAVQGFVWLGNSDIDVRWFISLYKKYVKIQGINFILLLSLCSFFIGLLSALTGFICAIPDLI